VKNQFTTFGGLKENPACAGWTPDSLKRVALRRGAEAGVGHKRDKIHNFQHSRLIDGQTVEGGANLSLAGSLPEDGRARCVATAPDLAKEAGGVKVLDALSLAGG
jgi:hypothetical protein